MVKLIRRQGQRERPNPLSRDADHDGATKPLRPDPDSEPVTNLIDCLLSHLLALAGKAGHPHASRPNANTLVTQSTDGCTGTPWRFDAGLMAFTPGPAE